MTNPAPAAPLSIGQRLTRAAVQLSLARLELQAAEAEMQRKKAVVDDLEQKLLPDLMEEAGSRSWTGTDGLCITINDKVRTNTKNPELHEWLRKTGNGGLIKSVVEVPFTKGKDEDALGLVKELAGREIRATYEQDVAWQSLQTLVRDMLKRGEDVPLAKLNIHLMPEATIKLPKAED